MGKNKVNYIFGDYSKIRFNKKYDIVVSVIGIHHQNAIGKKKLFKAKKALNNLYDHIVNLQDEKEKRDLSTALFNLLEFSISQLIEEYRKIHKKGHSDFFYLFLDEVSSRDNFEQELKSIYDNENIKVICSSSIATLMRDKKAKLTGRTKTIEIMPLDFREFLIFKEANILKSDKAKLESYFNDYLRIGGIPHYVLTEDKSYLNELVESIIYKDIIAYHKITAEKVIKEMFILLCQRVGKPISYNKLSNLLHVEILILG